jgi:hypothetical protein
MKTCLKDLASHGGFWSKFLRLLMKAAMELPPNPRGKEGGHMKNQTLRRFTVLSFLLMLTAVSVSAQSERIIPLADLDTGRQYRTRATDARLESELAKNAIEHRVIVLASGSTSRN